MISFLDQPSANGPSWLKFGGREALESYGLSVSGQLTTEDWPRLRDELQNVIPRRHLSFLRELRLAFLWRDYLFVHAGLDPDKAVNEQSAHDLMWIREPFLSTDRDWGVRVVHGHVIVAEPDFRTNRIGIDTGAYRSGQLTCLVADSNGTRMLQTPLEANVKGPPPANQSDPIIKVQST